MPQLAAKHLNKANIFSLMGHAMTWHQILSVSGVILLCFLRLIFSLQLAISIALLAIFLLMIAYLTGTVSATPNKNQQMIKMPSRLIIYANDVMQIHSCSATTAGRKMKLAKEFYDKKDHQVLTIKEYCTYWSLDYVETCQFLKLL